MKCCLAAIVKKKKKNKKKTKKKNNNKKKTRKKTRKKQNKIKKKTREKQNKTKKKKHDLQPAKNQIIDRATWSRSYIFHVYLSRYLWELDIHHFYKGDNFCNFMFVVLFIKSLFKGVYFKRKNLLPLAARVDLF